jgi:hypothetical protein
VSPVECSVSGSVPPTDRPFTRQPRLPQADVDPGSAASVGAVPGRSQGRPRRQARQGVADRSVMVRLSFHQKGFYEPDNRLLEMCRRYDAAE